mgnify:CR=1 FL=1
MTDQSTLQVVSGDASGLVPAMAQQHGPGEVLVLAWMSAGSLTGTVSTGQVCHWSRSRQAFWRKREVSGHGQRLIEYRSGCDGDMALALVGQTGTAGHTDARTCFFNTLAGNEHSRHAAQA